MREICPLELVVSQVHAELIRDTVSLMMSVKTILNVVTIIVLQILDIMQKLVAVTTIVLNGWT